MLSIYNETKTPWDMDVINESVVRISKVKDKLENDKVVKSRSVRIISYTQSFDDIEHTKTQVANLIKTKEPIVITDKTTSVIFNRKEFKPFITERSQNNPKDVLFGSIFLGGRKVIRVHNNNTFLLEYFMLSADFSFIASFNRPESILTVELLREETNVLSTYVFFKENNEIKLTCTEKQYEAKEIPEVPFKLKSFRPSRPTHVVLVKEKDRILLEDTIDVTQHTVLLLDVDLDKTILSLRNENYKAVTVFSSANMGKEPNVEYRESLSTLQDLGRSFQTVFKLFKDGKIFKSQY